MDSRYHVYGWTSEEDKKLADVMIECMNKRLRITETFAVAGERLQRSPNACKNRWYIIRENYIDKRS